MAQSYILLALFWQESIGWKERGRHRIFCWDSNPGRRRHTCAIYQSTAHEAIGFNMSVISVTVLAFNDFLG